MYFFLVHRKILPNYVFYRTVQLLVLPYVLRGCSRLLTIFHLREVEQHVEARQTTDVCKYQV